LTVYNIFFLFLITTAFGRDVAPTNGSPASDRLDWWAFKPATRPPAPQLSGSKFSIRNPVDNFILSKISEHHLVPSPEADRHTLIRRLSFDLTGLAPTLEEVDTFLSDSDPNAYEKLVDRLLSSPRYGEHWARHWLDVVHFGETHGYDKDKLRTNAWPYRDYVIQAFNQDKPYSRFVQEQLAADVLFPNQPELIPALGFIAAGPWDYVGHVELPISKTDGLIARYNDRDDMVMTTISTFESLTVHCARCHDHKFDPITQKDYYSLQAVFAGVDRANRPYDLDNAVYQRRSHLLAKKNSLKRSIDEMLQTRARISNPELERLDAELAASKSEKERGGASGEVKSSPSNGYHSELANKAEVTKWVQIDLGRSQALDQIGLVPARPTDFADSPGFGFPIRFKIEVSEDPKFDAATIVADHTANDFPNPGENPVVIGCSAHSARYIRVTATKLWERTKDFAFALAELQVFVRGTNVARGAAVTALDSIESGRWSRSALVDGFGSRTALKDVLPTPEELAQAAEIGTRFKRLNADREQLFDSLVPASLKTNLALAQASLKEVEKQISELPPPVMVYAAANDFPIEGNFMPPTNGVRAVHLLARGDVKRPKEEVTAAALPCVPGPQANFVLNDLQSEGARRAALANWLTDPKNMLTRRSIVNRIWQYHFGRGIVDTPSDFGHMGAVPTHPELLDWLAFWFVDHGESLKALHRLLVTSATYRQVSSDNLACSNNDGENRYLWRMTRTRLDAECIRDEMLQVSGKLDLRMGGPSDRQFVFKDDHSPVYDYNRFDVDSPAGCRRAIYRHIVRSVPDPFMDCLDAADPSQLVARRYTTITALQALATLNNPFVLRQCENFAKQIDSIPGDLDAHIEWAFRVALARKPTLDEAREFAAYARQHGIVNLCRVIFNCSEFVFVD
jgi:hypothetical protein